MRRNIDGSSYVTLSGPSTGPRDSRSLRDAARVVAAAWFGVLLASCASAGTSAGANPAGTASSGAAPEPTAGAQALVAPDVASSTTATLSGARCQGPSCTCRTPGHDDAEDPKPAAGFKRFEIRIAANGGKASLAFADSGTLVGAGDHDTCYYVDLPAGRAQDATFVARESNRGSGVGPRLHIAEYGPAGDHWYDIFSVSCRNGQDRCDRQAVDAWAGHLKQQRKRGRLDPCGSSVIAGLRWQTHDSQSLRDGGLYRDLVVAFNMDVKKFATQFAPGSTECVPK